MPGLLSLRCALVGAALFCSQFANGAPYEVCGSLENAYGPFDYRTQQAKIKVVERYHFTEAVAMLQKGHTGSLGADIDYTLRASPNHPRALEAISNLAIREKSKHPRGAYYTVDCYFDRAIRFAPTDGTVYMLYGTYLYKSGDKQKARAQMEIAERYSESNGNLHYNLGLVYLDAKEYDKALAEAHRAYALGFPLSGLKTKLMAAGKWRDPLPTSSHGPSGIPVPR